MFHNFTSFYTKILIQLKISYKFNHILQVNKYLKIEKHFTFKQMEG